jgi:hypothetical protein
MTAIEVWELDREDEAPGAGLHPLAQILRSRT